MQVLIVNPGINVYGGAELVIVKLANYLTQRGIRNSFLTTAITPEMKRDLDGTKIILMEASDMPIGNPLLRNILLLYIGVHRLLKDFDVVNVHNFPAELSVFPCRKPVVWMCNEPPEICLRYRDEKSLFKKLLKKVILIFDKFVVRHYIGVAVVADEFNAVRFRRIYGFSPEIINYGIDHDFFSQGEREKAREEFGLSGRFVVLQVGMLTPMKNQLESIKTIEKLKEKIPHIKLVLAGWGEDAYLALVKQYIKEKNLEDKAIITGHLNRVAIRDLYQAADALLHPIKSQGGWLAPFEALCAKRPVVVSPEMTAADIIKKENIGIVTKNFAEAILDIYNNSDKYREMAIKGQKWVRENLSWDKFCEEMLNIFLQACQGGK